MATKRKSGDERRKHILDCAAKLVGKHGAKNVTRRMVAKEAKLSDALIAHYFGPIADAQKKFRAHAKKLGVAEPSKDKIEAIGEKLRKKPRKVVAPGTAAVRKALKKAPAKKATVAKKSASASSSTPAAKKSVARASASPRKRSVAEVKAIKDKAAGLRPKSAARAPKAPPPLPPLPVPNALPPLPLPLADAA